MRLTLALVLALFCGCASENFSVTLFRSNGASGISERYGVDQNGLGTKTVIALADSDSKRRTCAIDPALAAEVRRFVTDSLAPLSAIQLHDTSSAISGVQIVAGGEQREIAWANVDPPELSTPALDSLYHLMLRVETQMAIQE
ncbi:MAG TPA: hypothetical protein VFH95_08490 [Candidatus Kapabacteria bacterium]|nr:hypothetical protein [Candidatus Kapabacteria bacterium]